MSVTCQVCGLTSYHPVDEQFGWCSACNRYTGDLSATEIEERALHLIVAGDGVGFAVLRRLWAGEILC